MSKLPLYEGTVELRVVDSGPKVTISPRVKYYLEFNGVSIPVADDMLELLDDLNDSDGFCSRLVIYDEEVAEALVKAGLASKNIRGSYGYTALFKDVYQQLYDKTLEIYDYKPNVDWTPTDENVANLPAPIREYIEQLKAGS